MAQTIEGTATPSLTEQQARELLQQLDPGLNNPTAQQIEVAREAYGYVSELMRTGEERIVAAGEEHGLDGGAIRETFDRVNAQLGSFDQHASHIRQQEAELAQKLEKAKRNGMIGAVVGLAAGIGGGILFGRKAVAKWEDRSLPKWAAWILTPVVGTIAGTLTGAAIGGRGAQAQLAALQAQAGRLGDEQARTRQAAQQELGHLEHEFVLAVLDNRLKPQPQPQPAAEAEAGKRFAEAEVEQKSPLDHATRPAQAGAVRLA